MPAPIAGLHHVTAIAADPQANVDFYMDVLGLRLVKRTVNFDAPDTYHLYYGDERGNPGTILTFFPWPGARRGRRGAGQVTTTSFSIPSGSSDFWLERLARHDVAIDGPTVRFGEPVIAFTDPDGLQVELIAQDRPAASQHWADGPVPAASAVRGFHSVTITANRSEQTAGLLTRVMGFQRTSTEGHRTRFVAGDGTAPGACVDIVEAPGESRGIVAVGTVHHIAFRTPSDRDQMEWRGALTAAHVEVTPPMDRQYFHSIYFNEPGGVLFEIATDPPGFTRDEAVAELGSHLKLPPWLETNRSQLEAILPPLDVRARMPS
jgi:glyoxalase family protein